MHPFTIVFPFKVLNFFYLAINSIVVHACYINIIVVINLQAYAFMTAVFWTETLKLDKEKKLVLGFLIYKEVKMKRKPYTVQEKEELLKMLTISMF